MRVVDLRPVLVLLAGVLVWAVAPPAPAQAEPAPAGTVEIELVEVADDGTVSVLLGVGPDVAPESVEQLALQVDGRAVEVVVAPVVAGTVERTTVLALDVSRSMRGAPVAAAREAALLFLETVPDDVRVGLVTFAGSVRQPVAPTTDRAAVAGAVGEIVLGAGTRLHDGVARAARATGSEGARSVLLLSDGRDRGSRLDVARAGAGVAGTGAGIDAVALEQRPRDRRLLGELVREAGGTVVDAADEGALSGLFAAEADALERQVLLSFARPADVGDEVTLAVLDPASPGAPLDSALVSLGSAVAPPTAVATAGTTVGRTTFLVGLAGLGLGLLVVTAVALGAARGPTRAQSQVAAYLGTAPSEDAGSGLKASAVGLTDRLVRADLEQRVARRLAGAGLEVTVAEWLLLRAGLVLAPAALGLALGGPVMMVLGLAAGAVLPELWLRRKHSKRLAAFGAQLAETLSLVAGGLSAGLSVAQAIDTVVREGQEPMAGELRRALSEHRLGVGIEEALDSVAERMGSDDFAWVVMAIRIQREVGGNLAELLTTVSETLREREFLRRQVRTLSSEGRLSAWILGCLPVGMFVFLFFTRGDFVRPLYTTGVGLVLLAIACMLLALGSFTMSRMVKVEV
jgi:tight adherence protein B